MELDSLKQVWKEQQTASFSRQEILKMLKKRSSSVAKWIFYISLGELFLGIILNFVIPNFNIEEQFPAIVTDYLDIYLYVNYFFIAIFIILFFKNYKKIAAKSSISDLLQAIIRTRKTVNVYILYNLIFFGFSTLLTSYWVLEDKLPYIIPKGIENGTGYLAGVIVGVLIGLILALGTMYLFYRLLYGFLLRRLKRNYKEIQQLQ